MIAPQTLGFDPFFRPTRNAWKNAAWRTTRDYIPTKVLRLESTIRNDSAIDKFVRQGIDRSEVVQVSCHQMQTDRSAQVHKTAVQNEAKRTGLVATMRDVGLLRLLGEPRDERLARGTLGGLWRDAVDLGHHDVLPLMHVDAELDHSVRFAAWCGGGGGGVAALVGGVIWRVFVMMAIITLHLDAHLTSPC